MRKYTQEDFDSFPVVDGIKQCPSGDYTAISSFAERCEFEGVGKAKTGYPFISYVGAGSRRGSKVYFFNLEIGIYVRCGCFAGTIDSFVERVKSKGADEDYLIIADLAKKKFSNN